MLHRNHAGLAHRRMAHQSIFQIDRADPLAARLHQVLSAVHQPDAAVGVHGGDVSGAKPAIGGPAVTRFRRVVIASGNPRPADFKLAHGPAVAWSVTLFIANADVNKRERPSLLGAGGVLLIFRPAQRFWAKARDRCLRRGLGHAPGGDNVEAVAIRVANEALRW